MKSFRCASVIHRLVISTGVTLLAASWFATSSQATSWSTWDPVQPVPFASGALKTNGWNEAVTVSCATPGNCTAGGEFQKPGANYTSAGFLVSSTNGVWGEAVEVAFDGSISGPLNYVTVNSVSCVSPGNCAAVGKFLSAEAFVVTSVNGVWGLATRVSFPSNVRNSTPYERLVQVSCTSAGNCTAVGNFRNSAGTSSGPNEQAEAFTVSLTNGVWGQARPVVFANGVTQHSVPRAYFKSVSCTSPGNCTAVGSFRNSADGRETFVTTSTNGVWSDATPVTFPSGVQPTQVSGWGQDPESISCGSFGNCAVVGGFTNTASDYEAFTVTMSNGAWGQATPVAFATGVQNQTPWAVLKSVSCATSSTCVAAGAVTTNSGIESFTVSMSGGVWAEGRIALFPPNTQDPSRRAEFRSISCASAGNCTASGYFRHQNGSSWLAHTMTSTNGVWDTAVPAVFAAGVQHPSSQDEMLYAVSCASAGNCAAVGYFNQDVVGYRVLAMMSTGSAPSQTSTSTTTVAQSSSTTVAPSGGAGTTTTTNTSLPATLSGSNAQVLPHTGAQSDVLLLVVGCGLLSLGVVLRRRFT